MNIDTENLLRFGLRFKRGEALLLRLLASRVRSGELGNEGAQLYDDAAEATERGEALIVLCEYPVEIEAMAAGFVAAGFERPAIEDLNPRGTRFPARPVNL